MHKRIWHRGLALGLSLLPLTLAGAAHASVALSAVNAVDCRGSGLQRYELPSSEQFFPQASSPFAPWVAKLDIIERDLPDGRRVVRHCGASVLDSQWLLTAAHCVSGNDWDRIEVSAGATNLLDSAAVRRVTHRAFCHIDYGQRPLRHDIALVYLDNPLPAGFPQAPLIGQGNYRLLATGNAAFALGWQQQPASSNSLRVAPVEIRGQDPQARLVGRTPRNVTDGLCVGESGSPLLTHVAGALWQIGVFSSVEREIGGPYPPDVACGNDSMRVFFTPVADYQFWISQVKNTCRLEPWRCDL